MSNFKVRDRVRIRSWESMEKEFGTFANGSIKATFGFASAMNNLCGHTATISDIDGKKVSLKDWDDDNLNTAWGYSTDMLEPVTPRICYLLGGEDTPLEIGEKFEVDGECSRYYISEDGVMHITGCAQESASGIYTALNHPEKIIRKPKIEFSDDEKAFMRLLVKKGYKWIARDRDDTLAIFTGKPKLVGYDYDIYMQNSGDDGCHIPDNLFPQITFENSPIRMEEYL